MSQTPNTAKSSHDQLFSAVYDRLKQIAHQQLARDHKATINTTSLVHELYENLVLREQDTTSIENFFAYAATCMRRIVIDHARARMAQKAGGAVSLVTLSAAQEVETDQLACEVLALDEALNTLVEVDQRAAKIVELRYFVGLKVEEIAELLQLNRRTILRDWDFAKSYLKAAIEQQR